MWLREDVNSDIIARSLKREQVLHDLLVAEVCVRIIEGKRHGVAMFTDDEGLIAEIQEVFKAAD